MAGTAVGGSTAPEYTRTVYVVNTSKSISNTELRNDIPAFQKAADIFEKYWSTDVQLVFAPSFSAVPKKAWYISVQDDSTAPGALGYHDYAKGRVMAYIFAKASLDNGVAVSEVFTHELFEMMADPYINRLDLANNTPYLVEVSDPVEGGAFDFTLKNAAGKATKISDFVYPQYYDPSSSGPFDYTHHVTRPLELLDQGYISYWTPEGWQQLFGDHARPVREG